MPTPNTPFTAWYEPIRAILGDEALYGEYQAMDAAIDSCIRSVFAMGKLSAGLGLSLRDDNDSQVTAVTLGTATNVFPLLAVGGPGFSEIMLRAALPLMINDEGEISISGRPLSVRDYGARYRRMVDWIMCEIDDIEAGDAFSFNPATWNQYLESR